MFGRPAGILSAHMVRVRDHPLLLDERPRNVLSLQATNLKLVIRTEFKTQGNTILRTELLHIFSQTSTFGGSKRPGQNVAVPHLGHPGKQLPKFGVYPMFIHLAIFLTSIKDPSNRLTPSGFVWKFSKLQNVMPHPPFSSIFTLQMVLFLAAHNAPFPAPLIHHHRPGHRNQQLYGERAEVMLAQGIHTGVHDQGSLHTDLNFFDFKQAALRKNGGWQGWQGWWWWWWRWWWWCLDFSFSQSFFFFGRNRRATCRSNRN